MNSLLELPQNVWRDNIVFFLNKVEDLVRVDSAVMSKILRETFLANIRGCKRFEHVEVKRKHGLVRWCVLRNVIASSVDIVGDVQLVDANYIPEFVSNANVICLFTVSVRDSVSCLRAAATLLDLSLYDCDVPDLSSLAECALLEHLRIQECPNVSNERLIEGITGCLKLKTCYIGECPKLEADCIVALLQCCVVLRDLHLSGSFDLVVVFDRVNTVLCLESFVSVGQWDITPEVVRGIADFMPCLHTLRLQHSFDTVVTDADIGMLVRKCSSLTNLQLSRHTLLTSAALVTIARQLTRMITLQICGCPAVLDEGVIALAQSLVNLRTLQLSDLFITDASIQAVGTHCRVLEDLDVSYCSLLTDGAFSTLNAQTLGCLNVSGTRVTGTFASVIFRDTSALHCFDCFRCYHFNSSFVRVLRPYHQLRTLRMGSVFLKTTAWLKLSTIFPSIRQLEIHHVQEVNDDVARGFYTNCPKLIIASFTGCNVSPKYNNVSEFHKLSQP